MNASTPVRIAVTLAMALVVVAVSAACGGTSEGGGQASPAGADSGDVEGSDPSPAPAIYAAVVRELVSEDNTFGGHDPGFKIVYVVDGVVRNVADVSEVPRDPTQPFPSDVKDEVESLSKGAGFTAVEFVAKRDSVVGGTRGGASPGHVKNGGVLISLGPIEPSGKKVEVGTSLWINGLAGQWLTYVLAETAGTWEVTGTTGPMAIS